jgi:hypothetical protein
MSYDKVIFLDFDGVLNSDETEVEASPIHPYLYLDPKLAKLVQQICDRTNAVIVLSTSWRTRIHSSWSGESYLSLDELKEALSNVGLTADVVDVTPDLAREDYIGRADMTIWRCPPRHKEITAWIEDNKPKSFVILDDDLGAEIKNHFVHTLPIWGITQKDVEKAVNILNNE